MRRQIKFFHLLLEVQCWGCGSTDKAEVADALSKNDMERFRRLVPDSEELPRAVPRTVLTWLQKPYVDFDLGRKIVAELKVNGLNVYDSMM